MKRFVCRAGFALVLASGVQAADQYWSGGDSFSDNIDQAGNWFTSVPSSGDNLYFNNTTGSRHWPFSNYGVGSYFGEFVTYTGAGGIKFRGDKTYLLKFENFSDPVLLESEADLSNRTGPDNDLEINPVGNGGVTVTNVDLQNGKQLKVYGAKSLKVNGSLSQSGTGNASMAVLGGATVVLNGANSMAGGLLINSGLVVATNRTDSLGAGTVTLGGGNLTIGAGAGVQGPIALSGWKTDMIVEKTAASPGVGQNSSVSSWAYYEQGAPNSTQGLPSNGTITSVANPSVVFQLQPYATNNVVINSGTVTLDSPASYGVLQLLVEGQGSGGATFYVSLGFADGSTTTVQGLRLPDWTVNGNNAKTLVGLVTAANASWTGFYTNTLNLFETDLVLSAADRMKTLTSVSIQNVANNVILLAASGQQASPYLNDLVVTSNTLVTVTADGGARLGNLTIDGHTLSVTGRALEFGAATLTGAATLSPSSGSAIVFTNSVGGSFALTKSGAGDVALGAASTFTGDLVISQGVVRGIAPDVLPNGSGKGNVTAHATLDAGGHDQTVNGLNGAGFVDNSFGVASITNVLSIGGNDANGNFSGVILNSGSSLRLAKIGNGTQVLAGGSGHAGGTTVSGGLLQLSSVAPTVLTVTNARIWLDAADVLTNGTLLADGVAVTTWLNKGSLGTIGDFTNASKAAGALADNATFIATNMWMRNRPSVHLEAASNGSTDWQALMNGVNFATTNVTMFVVGRLTGTANYRMVGAQGNNWLMGGHGGNRGSLYLNNWVYLPAGNADQATYVYTAMKNGVAGYAWENGQFVGAAFSGNTQGPNQWRLGGGYIGNGTEYSSSDIAEVLLFDRALTDAERSSVEAYLMLKYNQQIPAVGGLNVVSGGTLDLNGQNLNLDRLTGDGLITNSGAPAALAYSFVSSNEFDGVISGPVSVQKFGAGNLTIGGSLPNMQTDSNLIVQGAVYLTKPDGSALPGDLTFDNVLSPDVYTFYDNQFSSNSVVSFITDAGDHGRFELLGTTQTVSGIRTIGYATARGVIQNREVGPANTATSTLVLAGSGEYVFTGYLRNQNGQLAVTKTGSGTQTLFGAQVTYSGPTRVESGTLRLESATAWGSSLSNSATVELFSGNATNWVFPAGRIFGGTGTYLKVGTGRTRFNNSIINGSGQWQIREGVLVNDSNACNWTNNTADLDVSAGAVFDLRADYVTINALTGAGSVSNGYGNGANVPEVLTLGVANGSGVFTGKLGDGPGNGAGEGLGTLALVKMGSGTQVIAGTNTYRGVTVVSNGTLSLGLSGSISNSFLILLANGATFQVPPVGNYGITNFQSLEGSGNVTGSITTTSGAKILPGRAGAVGTLAFANDLTLGVGLTNVFDLGGTTNIGGGFNDLITVGGTLTANTNLIVINLLAPPSLGTYRLFTCGSLVGGFNTNVVIANLGRKTATLDTATPGEVNLVISGTDGDLVWAGTNATWDGVQANWTNTATLLPDTFFNQDRVTFDDTGAAINTLAITTNVAPSWITVASSANYTFNQTGSGKISGVGGITKDGAGILTITTTNENTGALVVSNGTVQVGNGGTVGSLGGGTVTLAGGALTYFRSGNIGTATNIVSGSGIVNFVGNGVGGSGSFNPINLNNGSFSGTVNIANSRIVPANGQSFGSAVINVTPGAVNGQVYLVTGSTYTNRLNLAGIGWAEASGYLGALRLQNTTWSGPIVLTANARIAPFSGAGTISGTIGGPFELELAGNNTITLTPSAANTTASTRITGVLGAVIVQAGNTNALSTGPLVFSNGTLRLNGNNLSFASLSSVSGIGGTIQNNHASLAATLTVGSDGNSTDFGGTLANGAAAALALTKVGAGTLTLTNNQTHSGATTISEGMLSLGTSGTLSNSARIVISSAAQFSVPAAGTFSLVNFQSLEGGGLVFGTVTAAGNSSIRPGGAGAAATMTFANDLTIGTGTTNYFEIGTNPAAVGGGTNDLISVLGALSVNGGTLEVAPLTVYSNGTYTLMQGGSLTGAFTLVRNAAGVTQPKDLSLVYTNSSVLLVVADRSPLRWNTTNSLAWDNGLLFNWLNLSTLASDVALPGDALLFNDTAGVQTNVQITGGVSPSLVSIDAETNTFIFGGAGSVTSLSLLVKSGAGLAIITNNNFSPALTIISNGTLQVGAGTNTGVLGGSISNSATLVYFRSPNSTTLTNVHSGSGTTIFNGTGLSLQSDYNVAGDNSGLTGPIFVNNARVHDTSVATNDWMLGASSTIINVNTAGQVLASSPTTYNQKLSLDGNGWPETSGPFGSLRLGQGSTWAGEITLSNNASVGASSASGTITGPITGPFALSKLASGVVTLGGTSSVAVPRIIANNGTLWLSKSGVPAVPAGSVMQMGAANTIQPNLRMGANNQFGDGVVMVVSNTYNNWTRFDLMGTTQTLAGINDTLGGLVMQNAGISAPAAGDALIIISNATDNTLLSHIRDYDNLNTGGKLALTKNGAGTLTIGPVPTIGARASYSGDTTVNAGTLKLDTATLWASRIINSSTVELYSASGNWNLPNGRILTGAGTYTKTGAGTNTLLNVTNTASGRFLIQQGTLRNDGNACNWSNNTAAMDISAGAKFDMRADSLFIDALTGLGTLTNSFGNGTGTNDTLVVGVANGSGVFSGAVQDGGSGAGEGKGAFDFIKTGTGTQTLEAACSWVGPTTISNGTLIVNAGIGTSDVSIASGGTLGGTGTISGNVISDGAVAPGASAGVLSFSQNYTQSTNGSLRVEIGGPAAGTDYDQLIVSGTASLDGTLDVKLINSYVPTLADQFVIMIAGGGQTGAFSATNLPNIAPNAWVVDLSNPIIVTLSITNGTAATGYDLAATVVTNGLTGYQDDADGDGYANLLEYVTGGSLTNADALARMDGTRIGGLLALKFNRTSNSVDTTIIVEGANVTTNGANWIGIATNIGGSWGSATNVVETNGPSLFNVTALDTDPSTNRFLRLRITRP